MLQISADLAQMDFGPVDLAGTHRDARRGVIKRSCRSYLTESSPPLSVFNEFVQL